MIVKDNLTGLYHEPFGWLIDGEEIIYGVSLKLMNKQMDAFVQKGYLKALKNK